MFSSAFHLKNSHPKIGIGVPSGVLKGHTARRINVGLAGYAHITQHIY